MSWQRSWLVSEPFSFRGRNGVGRPAIAEANETLRDLAGKIDAVKMKPPAFRMIIVAKGEFAYRDKSGTIVCPITCLRP